MHCSSQGVVMHHSTLAKIHMGKRNRRVWCCQLQATYDRQALKVSMHHIFCLY